MLSHKAIRNIQAVLVLACPLVAWILVPGDILLPIAWATLAITIAGVFGIRRYMRKLDSESRLEGADRLFYAEVALALAMVGFAAFIVLAIEYS